MINYLKSKKLSFSGIFLLASFLLLSCQFQDRFLKASGTLEANRVVISSRTQAEVKQILVEKGSRVKKGDLLALLSNRLLELKLQQAYQSLALAENELALVSKGARGEDVSQAAAALVQAENNLKIAQTDYEKLKALYETGSITQKQFTDTEARYQIAQAQYQAALDNFNKYKNFFRPEEIKAAFLKKELALTNLQAAEEEVSYLKIIAPHDGVISNKLIEEGELVFAGSSLFSLIDLTNLELTIYASSADLPYLKLGQKAKLLPSFKYTTPFEGEIYYISPEAEFTPKNIQTEEERLKLVFAVKIKVANPAEILKPGMNIDVEIEKLILK